MKKIGIIRRDGLVEIEDGQLFSLPTRGTDDKGFPEVIIDATEVNGKSSWHRQSIKSFIGMKAEFTTYNRVNGFDFKVLPPLTTIIPD